MVIYGLAVGLALATTGLVFAMARFLALRSRLQHSESALADACRRQEEAAAEADTDRIQRAQAETRLAEVERSLKAALDEARAESRAAVEARDEALEARRAIQTTVALAEQQVAEMTLRMGDWEKTKAEHLDAARAATLQTASALSSKLLEDHKREAKAAREEDEKRVAETTRALTERFETITKSVAAINDQVARNRDGVATITRALSSPGTAGHAAETVLENTLKSFGLSEGRDYLLQHTYQGEGGAKRPDAIVFLPGETVMVIDSKASKFLMELAEAQDETTTQELYGRLKDTMNQHLRGLASKEYHNAVAGEYRRAERRGELRQIINVMLMPNDAAVEKVRHADPGFVERASHHRIIVAGPTALWAAVGVASARINLERQAENQERIVEHVHELLERVATMLAHADGVGKGIRMAADRYAKMSGSINSRLLPSARSLVDLGIEPPAKGMPKPTPSFHVVSADQYIDAEPEPAERPRPSELPAPEDGKRKTGPATAVTPLSAGHRG